MGQGYTLNEDSLAIRIGELKSLAGAVESAASTLETSGGDLGPGDINGAIQEVAQQWREGLDGMRDKIDTMADNVSNVVDNYDTVEWEAQLRFQQKFGV